MTHDPWNNKGWNYKHQISSPQPTGLTLCGPYSPYSCINFQYFVIFTCLKYLNLKYRQKGTHQFTNFIPLFATSSLASLTSAVHKMSSLLSIYNNNWKKRLLIKLSQIRLSAEKLVTAISKTKTNYNQLLASEKSIAGKRDLYSVMLLLLSHGWTPCSGES